MEAMLGVPVIPISAAKNEGVDELIRHAVHVAKQQEPPLKQDFCDKDDHGGAVHRCIHAVIHLIEDHAALAGLPVRFAATKAIEGDALILQQLQLDRNEQEMLEHIVRQMETERGLDRSAAIADMRFDFIERLCAQTVIRPQESKERIRSEKIDRILTGRYTAIPCFIGIMVLVFYLTFNVIGGGLQKLLELGIDRLSALTDTALTQLHVNPVIHSLVIDGIFTGVGSVLSFLPIIVTLFFFLSLMEDSGYIARVAFVMDKLLRRIGLSGKSIVPMLIGFGCTVPAVMATRTLTSERDRKMTILLTPFMSCTAKLPIYSFFVSVFFPGKGGLIMSGLYLLGILVGIGAAFLYKDTLFRGEPIPFVMELPNYRLPSVKNVGQLLWEKAKDFLQRAFSVILIATVVVWFLQSFGWENGFGMVEDLDNSVLAKIGKGFAWIFAPLGWGEWKAAVATVTGLIAKENVVTTFGQLFHFAGEELSENGDEIWSEVSTYFTALSAYSFLVFNLLCAPCFAAMGAIKREMNSAKWTLFAIGYQCVFAYAVSLIIYQVGSIFTGNVNVFGLIVALILIAFIIYMLVRPYKESNKLTAKVRIKS
jgi:ferrous iron transport protein B